MNEFCGEILYFTGEGMVHSDICHHNPDKTANMDEHRKFLHDCLDEWLNKSNGRGAFWVGDPEYFNNWEKE